MRPLPPMLATLAAALVLGCSGAKDAAPSPAPARPAAAAAPDPENSILEPGQQAVIAGPDQAFLHEAAGDPGGVVALQPGVRVTIGFDPRSYRETAGDVASNAEVERLTGASAKAEAIRKAGPRTYTYPDPMAKGRPVKVTVESGEAAGKSGQVRRDDLRPIK